MTNLNTAIEWCDATWNPATGCQPVSAGCDNCYARIITERFHGPGSFDKVQLHPERLGDPLRWRKAKKVFVNSMGELFHADVPDEYVAAAWTTMYWTSRHARRSKPRQTYKILTKRHARMRSWVRQWGDRDQRVSWIESAAAQGWCDDQDVQEAPFMPAVLPNVILGVSVEDQEHADLRIPQLLETPAALRFLSCEPLLGPVDLAGFLPREPGTWYPVECRHGHDACPLCDRELRPDQAINWVIVGGESTRGARPMHLDWARSLLAQCTAAGVPFFFKQHGEWAPWVGHPQGEAGPGDTFINPDGQLGHVWFNEDLDYATNHVGPWGPKSQVVTRVGKKRAGRELDGREWLQFPVVNP
jgi:protein gp37